MNINGIGTTGYPAWQGARKTESSTKDGFGANVQGAKNVVHIDPDAVFSIHHVKTGESANVYRADDFSEDNPVYLVKGTDINGNRQYSALCGIKRNRIKKRITANSHTLEEVMELLKREYGAKEVSQQSHNYLEQRMCLKSSLVMRRRPDLPGEMADLKSPEGEDAEALKPFWEQIQEREKMAAEIADDIFPEPCFGFYSESEAFNISSNRSAIGVKT